MSNCWSVYPPRFNIVSIYFNLLYSLNYVPCYLVFISVVNNRETENILLLVASSNTSCMTVIKQVIGIGSDMLQTDINNTNNHNI